MNLKRLSIALALVGSLGLNISIAQATGGQDIEPTKKNTVKTLKVKEKAKKQSKQLVKEAVKPVVPPKPSFGGVELPEDYKNISIFGEAAAMKEQAVRYIRANNPKVKLSCTVERLVDIYWQEAKLEGVRPDLALCQALVETGFFKYGGDVVYQQNNFCGLGTVGKGVRGASFKTPQLGVRAHIQHLLAYSEVKRPSTPIVDPRYELAHNIRLEKGVVDKWSGLNGTWAMGSNYCEKIMVKYQEMLKMPGARVVLPPVDPKDKYKTNIKVRIGHILNDNKE